VKLSVHPLAPAALAIAAIAALGALYRPAPLKSLAPPHAPIVEGRSVPVVPYPDQLSLLKSQDPKLAANKRVVFDLWRSVVNAGHVEVADQLLTERYVEHSPIGSTGREAFKTLFAKVVKRRDAIPQIIENPVVTLVAEGDYVALVLVDARAEPNGQGTYTTTHFDMWRIENGRIAEHWDSDFRAAGATVPTPENGGPVPVTGAEGAAQIALVQDADPKLFANKRLVFDLWRHTAEAGREETADLYLDPIYIQHNPNAATGRQGFKDYFAKRPDRPIEISYHTPIVALLAEGDLVAQAVAEERPVPDQPGKTYSLTHFDLFRIENGRIVEHWDNAGKGDMPPARK
jgi:predicted SnoaL-like aldol condensation-catalyzing enzyme